MLTLDDKKILSFKDTSLQLVSELETMGLKQFDDRIVHFKSNLASLTQHTIRSGLVGITSSGKSAVLNVLLGAGRQILKEQSKATTNMIVFCSHAADPALEIHFESKEPVRKSGDVVLSGSIWEYTSEDENPGNQHKVKFIKLGLPSFILGSGLEIADTPGLDAYGLKEHEDLTLREFLPQADLVIYLSSIRSPMKDADRKILNRIMDAEQQIVFVQTSAGAVVEQDYGDGATASVENLLDRYKSDFQKELSPYPHLKGSPIVQVETKRAMSYFKNSDESAWDESGFAELSQVIKEITQQLQNKFTIRELHKRVDEIITLNRLLKNSVREEGDKEKDITDILDLLQKLRYSYDKIDKDQESVGAAWTENLDSAGIYKEIKKELTASETDEDFFVIADTVGARVAKIKNYFLDALDDAKITYKNYFTKIGLDVRRVDMQEITKSAFFFPNVQKTTRTKESPEKKGKKELILDKETYFGELKLTLDNYFEPLLKHLTWWDNAISFSYLKPLGAKIEAFENDIANINKDIQFDKDQSEKLRRISGELDTLINDTAPLCGTDPFKEKIVFSKFKKKPLSTSRRRAEHKNLFIQLGNLLFENMFHTNYLRVLSSMTDSPERCIALIGQDAESQKSFLRRLMRLDDASFLHLHNAVSPFSLNMLDPLPGIKDLNIQGEFYGDLSFVVLGNDQGCLAAAEKAGLFKKADIIQVMIEDLHRVSSAVTDMRERNLFFPLLAKHTRKLLLSYSKAAYFQKDRLHLLVEEAVAEFDAIFAPAKTHWFIYENFEMRYNCFHEIALMVKNRAIKSTDCIDEWKSREIPLDEPFNEKILREQFDEITLER